MNYLYNPWVVGIGVMIIGGVIVGVILLVLTERRKTRDGLYVLKATFGKNNLVFDITDKLNEFIKHDKLNIVLSIDKFGDPIKTVQKIGKVKYRYNGKIYDKEYVENETIDLP